MRKISFELKFINTKEKIKEITFITYLLAGIGLSIGIISFILGFTMTSSSPAIDPSVDDLPDFGGFFKFVGISFISIGLFSLVGCLLFSKEQKVGWLMISLVYLGGIIVTAYFLLIALAKFPILVLMSPMFLVYIFLLIIGLYMLFNLIFKANFFVN